VRSGRLIMNMTLSLQTKMIPGYAREVTATSDQIMYISYHYVETDATTLHLVTWAQEIFTQKEENV